MPANRDASCEHARDRLIVGDDGERAPEPVVELVQAPGTSEYVLPISRLSFPFCTSSSQIPGG